MSGNIWANARKMLSPPACSAGKSFSTVKLELRAPITSVGDMTPGITGNRAPREAAASSGVKPGVVTELRSGAIRRGKIDGARQTSRTDDGIRQTCANCLDAGKSNGRAQTDFQYAQAAGESARAVGSASAMSVNVSSGMTGAKATISRMFIGMAHCATAFKAI